MFGSLWGNDTYTTYADPDARYPWFATRQKLIAAPSPSHFSDTSDPSALAVAMRQPTTRNGRESAKLRRERLRKRVEARELASKPDTALPSLLVDLVSSLKDMMEKVTSSIDDLKTRLPSSQTPGGLHHSSERFSPPGAPSRPAPAAPETAATPAPPQHHIRMTPDRLATVVANNSDNTPLRTLQEIANQAVREIEANAATSSLATAVAEVNSDTTLERLQHAIAANQAKNSAFARAEKCQRVSRDARGIPHQPTPHPHGNRASEATSRPRGPRTKITARKSVAFLGQGSHSSTKVKSEFTPVGSRGGAFSIPTPAGLGFT